MSEQFPYGNHADPIYTERGVIADGVQLDPEELADLKDPSVPKAPYPKVQAAGVAGAATIVLVFILGLLGVDVPQTVAAALTALLSVAAGYIKTE